MPRTPLRLAALLFVLGAAACSDRTPLAVNDLPFTQPQLTKLQCTARVKARSVSCAAAPVAGARGNLIVGGQNVYVKLTSSNTAYDGEASFTSDVTLQNLMRQPMGTADGVNPDPGGNLVFFAEGPTVTDGEGTVTVEKADSLGIFTGSNQPAYRYPGILSPYQVSAPRTWSFSVPNTVLVFTFMVYVSTRLPNETGWIDLGPPHPYVRAGTSLPLAATVRTAAGGATGAAVTWTAADSLVARVDSLGTVTGVAAGTTRIFASGGGRLDSLTVTVTPAAGDQTPPNLLSLELAARTANTSAGPVGIGATFHVTDVGTGTVSVAAQMRSPTGATVSATGCALTAGDANDGTWECTFDFPLYSEAGEWVVDEVTLDDLAGNVNSIALADLRRAGYPTTLWMESLADADGPALTALSAAADSIDTRAGVLGLGFTLDAADSLSGIQAASVSLTSPTGGQTLTGDCTLTAGIDASGTFE